MTWAQYLSIYGLLAVFNAAFYALMSINSSTQSYEDELIEFQQLNKTNHEKILLIVFLMLAGCTTQKKCNNLKLIITEGQYNPDNALFTEIQRFISRFRQRSNIQPIR